MLPFSSCDCSNRCMDRDSQNVNRIHDTEACNAFRKNPNAICQPNMFDIHRFSCSQQWFYLLDRDRTVHRMVWQSVAFPNSIHIFPWATKIAMVCTSVPRTFYSIECPWYQAHRCSVWEFDLNHVYWHRWNPFEMSGNHLLFNNFITSKFELFWNRFNEMKRHHKSILTISSAIMITILGLFPFILCAPWFCATQTANNSAKL